MKGREFPLWFDKDKGSKEELIGRRRPCPNYSTLLLASPTLSEFCFFLSKLRRACVYGVIDSRLAVVGNKAKGTIFVSWAASWFFCVSFF